MRGDNLPDVYDVMEFTLTEEHVKLFRRIQIGWQYCETGAPEVDPKRPYGNSDVASDVIEILGWPKPPLDEDEEKGPAWDAIHARALAVHYETHVALSVILCRSSFEPGTYVRSDRYKMDWKRK